MVTTWLNDMKKLITNREEAEELAVSALLFIANDPELMPRFLNITGINASDIRQAAASKGFLAGVLQFILAHEPTLMAFSERSGYPPQSIGEAVNFLPGGEQPIWL